VPKAGLQRILRFCILQELPEQDKAMYEILEQSFKGTLLKIALLLEGICSVFRGNT